MSDQTPMMRQYRRIKQEQADAILFFRLGDFYEMFQRDAQEASRILGLTLTQRQGMPMCGVPYHAAQNYIARLIKAGRKVAICEQTSDPKAGKGIVSREVVQVITPGTVSDEDYLQPSSNNYICALGAVRAPRGGGREGELSLAYADISTGELSVTSFSSREAPDVLTKEFARLQPREILVQESLLEESRPVQQLLEERDALLINRLPDWEFHQSDSAERLKRLFSVANLKGFGTEEDDPALLSVGPLLNYLEENNRGALGNIAGIERRRDEEQLLLDESTQRNLELVRNMQDGSERFTLFEVLNQCRTPMGSRLLRRRILSPARIPEEISRRLDRVEYLYRRQTDLRSLRDRLEELYDLERLASRLGLQKAHAKDLVAMARSLRGAQRIAALLTPWYEEHGFPGAEVVEGVAARIEEALAENPSILLTEGNLIAPEYDEELDELRSLRSNSKGVLNEYLRSERERTGIGNLRIKYNRIIGHFFEVTKSNLERVPDHFIRRQSLVNSERYTTDELAELESKLNGLEERIVERERELFLSLREELLPEVSTLLQVSAELAEVDYFHCLAWTATSNGYSRPRLLEEPELSVVEGRHPVVEHHLPAGAFVANSLELGSEKVPARFALITGPNMAGKSTYLRQNALIALLTHMGSFVPADSARVGLVDRLFCRVGASDNLARGESTFLLEMNETSNILRSATPRSLVIMDEVGRGTSTNDGLAIAQAVSEHLLEALGSRTLFATHFHELTAMEHPGLRNLSMKVAEEGREIIFLKRVVEGPSNNSYGIHVARLAGVPGEVVDRADSILRELLRRSGEGLHRGSEEAGSAVGGKGEKKRAPKREAPESRGNAAPDPGDQGTLFAEDEMIRAELSGLDVDRLTPLEALNLLANWKERLGDGQRR
ncbi:MAG: DNA mismatch repair protein MutS [Spirochaetaceae bacterium]